MLFTHIRIQIGERYAHTLRSILGRTEHDGLSHAIRTFQIGRDFFGNLLHPVQQDNLIVIVRIIINPVFNELSVDIRLPLCRTPAFPNIRRNIDDTIRRQETIIDAFLQTIAVDGIAKIINIRHILRFLRRSCHTDLHSRMEILQYTPPAAFLFGRTTMALIHNNQIKEIRPEQITVMLLIIIPNQLLIKRKIDLV